MIVHILLLLALLGLSLLLGATAYESVVMAPNFERDIPASIRLARDFLKRTTPAHYFRVISPLTQVVLLASVIAAWRIPPARWSTVTALGLLLAADVLTYLYHYPRLRVMFGSPFPENPDSLRSAAREWARGNVLRGILLLVAWLAVIHGLGGVGNLHQ